MVFGCYPLCEFEGFLSGLEAELRTRLRPDLALDSTSVIDVTLARLPRGSSISGWRVREDIFSDSDHRYVEYSLSLTMTRSQILPTTATVCRGWIRRKIDRPSLESKLRADAVTNTPPIEDLEQSPKEAVQILHDYL